MSAAKMMMKWDGWSNKKTYETIVFIWSFFVTFENAVYSWCDYHYTKSLKLLVIWCPGGKLIKWNDMKILTMTIQSFQYRKIFSWLNFDPFRKSIKINPFYEFVCPSYYFRAVKKIHDFFNLILKNVFGGLYLQNRNKKSADMFHWHLLKIENYTENRK